VPSQIDAVGREAAQQFEAAVARLNVQAAGRSVFAGLATDGPALRPGAEILDALQLAVAGAATVADVETALDTWFGSGGDVETVAYVGNLEPLRPIRVADGESVDLSRHRARPRAQGHAACHGARRTSRPRRAAR
jgi:flagellar hook-associated protein 3 FlgL